MGKNTIHNKKKKNAKKHKKMAESLNLKELSIDELLQTAQENIDTFMYETAQVMCQEAIKRDSDHVQALEISGSLCIETGNLDGGKHCYGRAITLKPDEGHEKYLAMAQLLEGVEAVNCFQKGIQLLMTKLNELIKSNSKLVNTKLSSVLETSSNDSNIICTNGDAVIDELEMETGESENIDENGCKESVIKNNSKESFNNETSLKHEISSAYCSISELYMTDLCDEEDAESTCKANINYAIESDLTNPEALQLMASFHLVKQETEEAKSFINKSVEMWLPKYNAVDSGTAAAGSFDPVEVCPVPYQSRLSAARILIEVEDYEVAYEVLQSLLPEDDEVVDVWYLLGWSSYLCGENKYPVARPLFEKALQVHRKAPSKDNQLIAHIKELLEEIGPQEAIDEHDEDEIENELDNESEDEEEMETS